MFFKPLFRRCLAPICLMLALSSGAWAKDATDLSPSKLGAAVLDLLSRADFAALTPYLCRSDGLSFSAYAKNLENLFLVRLDKDELISFKDSRKSYVWGRYDGIGELIRLTPMAYHVKFIYDRDYRSKAVRTHLDKRRLRADAEWAAVVAAYPDSDALIYRFRGTRAFEFKDARELILLLREVKQRWCLEGVSHSEDTV